EHHLATVSHGQNVIFHDDNAWSVSLPSVLSKQKTFPPATTGDASPSPTFNFQAIRGSPGSFSGTRSPSGTWPSRNGPRPLWPVGRANRRLKYDNQHANAETARESHAREFTAKLSRRQAK